MQGGNEYENNDDVNDEKCDPVFDSFVAYLSVHRPGKVLGFFLLDWSDMND